MDTPMPVGPAGDGQFLPPPRNTQPEEEDPYARAFEEHMNRARKSEPKGTKFKSNLVNFVVQYF